MAEYTVHYQKGTRVGARRLRMVHVEATSAAEAVKLASPQREAGFKLVRVDHFEGNQLEVDY